MCIQVNRSFLRILPSGLVPSSLSFLLTTYTIEFLYVLEISMQAAMLNQKTIAYSSDFIQDWIDHDYLSL